jgi:hypothetical protein
VDQNEIKEKSHDRTKRVAKLGQRGPRSIRRGDRRIASRSAARPRRPVSAKLPAPRSARNRS